jgi:hypothetical protein
LSGSGVVGVVTFLKVPFLGERGEGLFQLWLFSAEGGALAMAGGPSSSQLLHQRRHQAASLIVGVSVFVAKLLLESGEVQWQGWLLVRVVAWSLFMFFALG